MARIIMTRITTSTCLFLFLMRYRNSKSKPAGLQRSTVSIPRARSMRSRNRARTHSTLFSKVAVNLTKQSLFPQTSDPCGEVRFGRRVKTDEWITTGRVDYQMNDKHSLFGRYLEARRNQPTDFDGKNILTMSNGNLVQR